MNINQNTRVLLICPERGYCGWNTLSSLIPDLMETYGSYEPIKDIVETLEVRGYVTSQDTQSHAYWVVEKAIPWDIRGAVKNDEVPLADILKQLKV